MRAFKRRYIFVGWAATWSAIGAFDLATGRTAAGLALEGMAAAAGVAAGVGSQRARRKRHGDRCAEGDHQDQGAGSLPVPGHYAGSTIGGTVPAAGAGVEALPERESDTPIRAWKRATLASLRDGSVAFRGIGHSELPYGIESTAMCGRGFHPYYSVSFGIYGSRERLPHGAVPELNCTCGFYALDERPESSNGTVTLEVELYGRVIRHERGYRAEQQRVLAVRVDSTCRSALCSERAALVGVADESTGTVVPFCQEHADLLPHTAMHTPVGLASIAGLLGTEVRWADGAVETEAAR